MCTEGGFSPACWFCPTVPAHAPSREAVFPRRWLVNGAGRQPSAHTGRAQADARTDDLQPCPAKAEPQQARVC